MGLLFLLLGILLIPEGKGARQAYLFDALNRSVSSSAANGKNGNHLGLSFSQYESNLTGVVHTGIDLSLIEIALKAADLVTKGEHPTYNQILGIEISRSFVANASVFGRMGLGYFEFYPGRKRFVEIAIEAGSPRQDSEKWIPQLSAHYFLSLDKERNSLSLEETLLRGQCLGVNRLTCGGKIQWTYRLGLLDTSEAQEHMSFAIGPVAKLGLGNFQIHLELLEKIWLDRQRTIGANTSNNTSYPVQVGLAAALSVVFYFP